MKVVLDLISCFNSNNSCFNSSQLLTFELHPVATLTLNLRNLPVLFPGRDKKFVPPSIKIIAIRLLVSVRLTLVKRGVIQQSKAII